MKNSDGIVMQIGKESNNGERKPNTKSKSREQRADKRNQSVKLGSRSEQFLHGSPILHRTDQKSEIRNQCDGELISVMEGLYSTVK